MKPIKLKRLPAKIKIAAKPTPRKLWVSVKTNIMQPTVKASVVNPPITESALK
jgi:hypothetical protein